VTNPIAQALPTPALRKVREGRGTHFVGEGRKIKSLCHPPNGLFFAFLVWPHLLQTHPHAERDQKQDAKG
jgi:hypothetical protein